MIDSDPDPFYPPKGECCYQEHPVLDYCRAPAPRFILVDGVRHYFCDEHYGNKMYEDSWKHWDSTVEY